MLTETKRRVAIGAGIALLGFAAVVGLLWYRCGLHGCPDVDKLKGYMPDEAAVLIDRDGEEIGKLFVERRVFVPLDSLPEHVVNAFVAMEDKRFWSHDGVDWRRVFGALLRNVKAGGIEEGSSTITMQLARNVFPEQLPAHKKTLRRKVAEARVASQIEDRYEKREILELYLNQIYFGNGAYGIASAAEEYFGKSAAKLTLAEGALLAALPRAPSRLNPRTDEEAAREGRELVLARMAEQGLITAEQRDQAADDDVKLRRRRKRTMETAAYFIGVVRQQLESQLGEALYTEGYTIHTTLDLTAQRVAEQELGRQLDAIESGRFGRFPHATRASVLADTANRERGTPYLQGALVLMEARTGDVLALIGGRDFDDSEFNRAVNAKRQPGSAFKPFVYAAAISAGFAPTHRLIDRPLRYVLDNGKVWEPQNYESSYSGVVSMRDALTHSKNVATVRLASEVGLGRVIGMAEQLGLGPVPGHPSVVLGTAEVTPLQLTVAYTPFATLGQQPMPRFVTRVEDRNGVVVWAQQTDVRNVLDPATAFLTTSLMQDVVNRGTGTGVRAAGYRGVAAGKTGTTQDAADVWFVGFTPEIVGTIWIGLDQRKRIVYSATGGELAAPVWGRIMARARFKSSGWNPPSGVEQRTVDAMGIAVGDGCPQMGEVHTEYFLRGMAPSTGCYPTGYAYVDTTAWPDGYYDELRDSLAVADTMSDPGWWERLRQRFLGRDTARTGMDSTRITTPPGTIPPPTIPPGTIPSVTPPMTTGRDTAMVPRTLPRTRVPGTVPVRPDTTRLRPTREPLGRPIGTRPRPDTIPG